MACMFSDFTCLPREKIFLLGTVAGITLNLSTGYRYDFHPISAFTLYSLSCIYGTLEQTNREDNQEDNKVMNSLSRSYFSAVHFAHPYAYDLST